MARKHLAPLLVIFAALLVFQQAPGTLAGRTLMGQGDSAQVSGATQWTSDGQSQFAFDTPDGHLCQTDDKLNWGCTLNGAIVAKIPVNVLPIGSLTCYPFTTPVITPSPVPTVLTPANGLPAGAPTVPETGPAESMPGIMITSPGGVSITPSGVTVGTSDGPGVSVTNP